MIKSPFLTSLSTSFRTNLLGTTADTVLLTVSWNGWDGTNDGSVTNFFTGGGYGPANVAGFSDTQALIVTNEQTVDDLYGLIVTRSGTSLSGGTVTKISEGAETVGQKASVGYITASRCLTAYETNSSANRKVALIDVSGVNPSVLDYAVNGNTGASTSPSSIYRHTDTLAVLISEGGTSGTGHTIQTVDITADTITLGTQTVMTNGATECVGCALSATTGMILDNTGINHYTISGGAAPTINGANLAMSPDGNNFSDRTVSKISDTRAVVIYRDSDDAKVYAQVVSWDGSSIIRGNVLEVLSTNNIQVQDNEWSCSVDETNGIVWVTWYDLTGADGVASVLRVRDIGTLELLSSEIVTFGDIQADHPSCASFVGGDDIYAITVCQDETTSPVKQVATKVIQGTGTGNELPEVGTDWVVDITTLSEQGDRRLDTNPPMLAGQGCDMHPLGTKIWQAGTSPDEVHEYTLGTAFNPSTAGSATQFDLNGTDNCFDVQWSSDGMTMWTLMDGTTQYIQQYTATTNPYDVTDLTYDTGGDFTITQDSNPKSFWVAANDEDFFVNGQTTDTVYQYQMSTTGDMATASYQTKSYTYTTPSISYGLGFNVDQSQMILCDDTNFYTFTLGTPGDVSGTVTPSGSHPTYIVGSSSIRGFSIRQDNGSELWAANPNTDFIHTFGLIAA
jgi:hypothetical protein